MSTQLTLRCPPSMAPHVRRVLDGEYNLGYEHPSPVVIDLGANVGSFALWAANRWPASRIHCYEPLPESFQMLRENTAALGNRVSIYNFAIGDPRHDKLFPGANNCGEASFFPFGRRADQSVVIETRPPADLPPAQIIKIDTEGAEAEILSMMPSIQFDVVLLEYHSEENRRKVDELLRDYVLVGGDIRKVNCGVLKYVRRSLALA